MKSFLKIFLIAAGFLFAVSCDAPRDNPVDPFNPNYKLGALDGYVHASTGEPLNDVKVFWKNENILVKTDTSGYYKLSDIATQNGRLYYEKDGFDTTSLPVSWNSRKSIRVEQTTLYSLIGTLDGFVYNSSNQVLSGVNVVWTNQNIITQTDSKGYFLMKNIALKDGNVIFEKNGFAVDTTYVQWGGEISHRILQKNLTYTVGRLSGRVTDPQSQDVSGVNVIWKNQDLIVKTDAQGQFSFENVAIQNGMLYFDKTGFAYDSLYVKWNEGQNQITNLQKSLAYTVGQIKGAVKTLAVPRKSIAGVKVFWKNTSTLVQTDATGQYQISDVPMKQGYLYFELDGYSRDSLQVIWGTQSVKQNDDVYLNAIPKLNSISVYSIATNKYGLTDPDYKFIIQASITDADLDIDTVFIKNSEFNFKGTLDYNPTTKYYEKTFYPYNLNLTSSTFGDAVGKLFDVSVKSSQINNSPGKLFDIGSGYIKRIINQEISIKSPSNSQIVSSKPLLEWNRFRPGFNFSYLVEIRTDDINKTLVWSKANVSEDDINVSVDTAISPGQYFWIISCVDEYGNRSDSKAGTFIIQ